MYLGIEFWSYFEWLSALFNLGCGGEGDGGGENVFESERNAWLFGSGVKNEWDEVVHEGVAVMFDSQAHIYLATYLLNTYKFTSSVVFMYRCI